MTRETGIIMSGNHPKLVMDGIKTQTRRVIKPQPRDLGRGVLNQNIHYYDCPKQGIGVTETRAVSEVWLGYGCPYGQVGDRLWVRETFAEPFGKGMGVIYRADYGENLHTWKPSIHMFRKDSRITLEITEVRAERVQDISQVDALDEGCKNQLLSNMAPNFDIAINPASQKFRELWDSLNAKRDYGWEKNPWVWCLSFKLINKQEK